MMRMNLLLLALFCLFCVGATGTGQRPVDAHPDSTSWPNLFNNDLSNAVFTKGVWTISDGELTASQDQCIWTDQDYENFVLDLEFKMGEAANSGVIVYCADVEDWIPNSVEIQILDDQAEKWQDVPATWRCGGLFGHLAPAKQAVRKAGEWNRMTIVCRGPRVAVILNGEVVVEADLGNWTSAKTNPDGSEIPSWLSRPMAGLASKGRIGFQGQHGGAPIFFRNIKIKEG